MKNIISVMITKNYEDDLYEVQVTKLPILGPHHYGAPTEKMTVACFYRHSEAVQYAKTAVKEFEHYLSDAETTKGV